LVFYNTDIILVNNHALLQASVAVQTKSALLWNFTQSRIAVPYRFCWTNCGPI